MMASNHILTGAVIGLAVSNPYIAVPAAVVSHFVLDAMPHFGYEGEAERGRLKNVVFLSIIVLDLTLIIFLIILFALSSQPLLLLYGFAGYSPDIMWLIEFSKGKSITYSQKISSRGALAKFHAGIQHFEHPLGIFVEAIVFGIGSYYLLTNI